MGHWLVPQLVEVLTRPEGEGDVLEPEGELDEAVEDGEEEREGGGDDGGVVEGCEERDDAAERVHCPVRQENVGEEDEDVSGPLTDESDEASEDGGRNEAAIGHAECGGEEEGGDRQSSICLAAEAHLLFTKNTHTRNGSSESDGSMGVHEHLRQEGFEELWTDALVFCVVRCLGLELRSSRTQNQSRE